MGNLPAHRTLQCKPFSHTGVDFCGTFEFRASPLRKARIYNGYIAVFVCLSTKAIHLEAVSDMTSEAVLAAYNRLVSIRGTVSNMYSDNGTNFVGGNNIMRKEIEEAKKYYANEVVYEALANQKVEWHFIPPSAPHFGGIWESGVKSVKYHLKRTLQNDAVSSLTYEQMATTLYKISACLNSRPLGEITEDLEVITPGHFLTGAPMLATPQRNILDDKMNWNDKWKICKKLTQEFWTHWRNDYLLNLQKRQKCQNPQENVKIGDIVLLKDDNMPESQWPIGKIIETHKGKDDMIRVVTIKTVKVSDKTTETREYKRPITKITVLPIESQKRAGSFDDKSSKNSKFISTKIMIALAFFALIGAATANCTEHIKNTEFELTPLTNEPHVFSRKMNHVKFINSKWTNIIHVDLNPMKDNMKDIDELFVQ